MPEMAAFSWGASDVEKGEGRDGMAVVRIWDRAVGQISNLQ